MEKFLYTDDGFETPLFDDDVEYNGVSGNVIAPCLCKKMEEYEDCPYNMERDACLDCEIILSSKDDHRDSMDLGYADGMEEDE